jgi:hypothetical protein
MSDTLDLGLDLSARPAGRGGQIEATLVASAALDLPGLRLSVDKATVTLSLGLTLVAGQGLRVVPELQVAPPKGAGAELSLPGFTGGGYLAKIGDEWRGVVVARLGPVSVTGFAILNTSAQHFSLLVLLAAEFTPPIQLSFGFTLIGVGGLIGLNRRADRDALGAAITSGALSRLLFPRDPVAQADQLTAALAACFPARDGAFVIGPLVKLGWGTPSLVSATIGVAVTSDGILILGRLAITLPFEQVDLIHLEATILGTIDADGLAIDASLTNSAIVGIPLDGDFKLRIRQGPDPLFAFSAGGFHPAFPVPAGMGGMRRIGTEISVGSLLRLRLEAYLAVTTNSVQFGAHAELTAGIAGFGIAGNLDFDALIIFDPFGFAIDLHARISVECADFTVASLALSGHLSGPSPWRIRGHASFSILWWDIDVDIPELVWGHSEPVTLPPARDPFVVLRTQLALPTNWTATSRSVPALVQLRPGVDRDQAAVHPLAELGFRQAAVPLATKLERMDGVSLAVPVTLTVVAIDAGGQELRSQLQSAPFIASQFLALDTTAQLASAGYTPFPAGLDVRPDTVGDLAAHADVPEQYQTTVLGKDGLILHRGFLDSPYLRITPPAEITGMLAERTRFVEVVDPAAPVVADVASIAALGGEAVLADLAATAGAALGRDNALAAAAQALQDPATRGIAAAGAVLSVLAAGGRDAGLQVVGAWEVTR